MPYDIRLYSPINSYRSFHATPVNHEVMELGPWQSSPQPSFDRPHIYRSTDELLPLDLALSHSPPVSLFSPRQRSLPISSWKGWKFGARLCIVLTTAVLILNVTVTSWASGTFGLSGGIGTIHEGPCPAIKSTGLWLHIAINLLSTLLLGASNYYMQCLCSPTRKEVDIAHSKRTWLDIGIQSLRNLRSIRRIRMVLWILFAATSIPLHIMFNSAIFVSLTANTYTVVVVREDFLNGATWELPDSDLYHLGIVAEMQQNASTYERLDTDTCIKQYGVDYLSNRRHVIVVVSNQNDTDDATDSLLGVLDWSYSEPLNSWICGTSLEDNKTLVTESIACFDCSIAVALSTDNQPWLMNDSTVEYCLSERATDVCRLQFAVPIMVVVLSCNFVKLLCMILTLWRCKEPALVTLGDAITSFLDNPDFNTRGMCTITKKEIESSSWPDQRQPTKWRNKRHFRFDAVGLRRWILSNGLCTLAVIAVSALLRFAIQNTTVQSDISTLYSLGFGAVSSSSLIRWNNPLLGSPGLMKNVLLANSPQLVLSILYITYNRLYTCMAFSKEWSNFAHRRQPLRVTSPRGLQRSSYFLSLPYRYILPILITSITTHWLLSQSLFLVAIDVFDENGNLDTNQTIITCGFSCIALIFLIGVGWLVLICTVGLGMRRYRGGIPLVGSCSAAISAACHPLADETDVASVSVKWGVVSVDKGVGHCALSGRYVSPPIPWRLYMGKPMVD